MRNSLILSCGAIIALLLSATASAENSAHASAFNYKVIKAIDLTEPFHAKSKWSFVVTQEPGKPRVWGEEPGPIHFCFVRNDKPDCSELPGISPRSDSGLSTTIRFDVLQSANVVRLSGMPLLRVSASEFCCGAMAGSPSTLLWTYRSASDRFERIFSHFSASTMNEETRLMPRGPLSGDIVISLASGAPPYHYGIVVYRLTRFGYFRKILAYTGDTSYEDGDRSAVIDSEMPEILRRLHLWKPSAP